MLRFFLLIATLLLSSLHPLAAQTAIPSPTTVPQVVSFTVSPAEIDRGGFVHLTWDVRGVESIDIEQYSGGFYKNSADVHYDNLPPHGTLTVQLTNSQPTDYYPATPYIYDAVFYLLPHDYPRDGYDIGTLAYKSVSIRCPYDGFFFGTDPYDTYCPITAPQTVDAIYQAFDNGFMLWRSDTQTVYTFFINPGGESGPAYAIESKYYVDPPPVNPNPNPTAVSHALVAEPFANVRATGNEMAYSLGGASAPAISYQPTIQDSYALMFGFDVLYFTTPDNRVIKFRTTFYGSLWSYMP